MRTLYLDSFAGIAGDMFAAAFLDAGLVEPEALRAVPSLLGSPDVEVEIHSVMRAGARFTHLRVIPPGGGESSDRHLVAGEHRHGGHHHHEGPGHRHAAPHHHHDTVAPRHHDGAHHHAAHHHHNSAHHHHGTDPQAEPAEHHHHHHYPYMDLVRQIETSRLDPFPREFALRVFRLLAEAEADSHGVPVEKVAFHEVGAVDSVVDVAMAGVCLGAVGPVRVLASPVKLGRGTVNIEHGTYPVPPPASARLAVGMPVAPVPEAISRTNVELSTPTGLAILKALEPGFAHGWPSGTLLAQGAGAGTMDLGGYPNVFRVALFQEADQEAGVAAPAGEDGGPSGDLSSEASQRGPDTSEGDPRALPYDTDRVVELRCNVDDQTGERTAWLTERALEMGALDAWVTPLVGKKGRPAACIVLLVAPERTGDFADFLLRHSSSFGVRYATWDRLKLIRETEVRQTPMGPVSFSVGRTRKGEKLKEKPEFEDLKKVWREDPGFQP
jgi:pyridinium-3,5-bisthiocarboxylic acid mononucleotide nickel chelatase